MTRGGPRRGPFGGPAGQAPGALRRAGSAVRSSLRRKAPRLPERWQSGRSRRTRNAEYGQPYRGFESLPLRHKLLILNDNFEIPDRIRTCPGVSAGYARPNCAVGRGDRFGAVVRPLHRQKSPIGFRVVPLATDDIAMPLQFEGLERRTHRRVCRWVAAVWQRLGCAQSKPNWRSCSDQQPANWPPLISLIALNSGG